MANEEHVKILKQGEKVWNTGRKENPNVYRIPSRRRPDRRTHSKNIE